MKKNEKTRIQFDYGGEHFNLEYTANSLKKLEKNGVNFAKLDEMVFSAPEVLFRGAFYANHPTVPVSKIHEIYLALKRTTDDSDPQYDDDGNEVDELSTALAEMLREAVEEITGRGGNVNWKIVR